MFTLYSLLHKSKSTSSESKNFFFFFCKLDFPSSFSDATLQTVHKNREMGTFISTLLPQTSLNFLGFSGALIKLKMSQLNKGGSTFFQLFFFYPFLLLLSQNKTIISTNRGLSKHVVYTIIFFLLPQSFIKLHVYFSPSRCFATWPQYHKNTIYSGSLLGLYTCHFSA